MRKKLKQHQLLAFIDEKKGQFNTVRNESLKVLGNGANFVEQSTIYSPFDPEDKDHPGDKEKMMITTVAKRLKYDDKFLKAMLNTAGQKEITNTVAKADIVIYDETTGDDTIVCTDVPVTLLIEYEKFIKFQVAFLKKLPTIDMNVRWEKGMNQNGDECYIAPEYKKSRSVKKSSETSFNPNPKDAKENNKFPLEPRSVIEDVTVGEYTTNTKDGRISPAKKAELIAKAEALHAAIKIARANANETTVVDCNYGQDILNFLNG